MGNGGVWWGRASGGTGGREGEGGSDGAEPEPPGGQDCAGETVGCRQHQPSGTGLLLLLLLHLQQGEEEEGELRSVF